LLVEQTLGNPFFLEEWAGLEKVFPLCARQR
jgi:hypothetical protein